MLMGNAQYRIGEDQQIKNALSNAALAMERALGCYESIDTAEPSYATHTNRAAAEEELKAILLKLGQQRVATADAQKQYPPAAEQALRDAMQAFERVLELDPKKRGGREGRGGRAPKAGR